MRRKSWSHHAGGIWANAVKAVIAQQTRVIKRVFFICLMFLVIRGGFLDIEYFIVSVILTINIAISAVLKKKNFAISAVLV